MADTQYVFLNPDKYTRAVEKAGGAEDIERVIVEYVKLGGAYIEDDVYKNVLGNPRLSEPLLPEEKERAVKVKEVAFKGVAEEKASGRKKVAPKPTLRKTKNVKK